MPDDSFPQPQADVDDLPADDIPADDLPSADLTDEDLPEVAELLDAAVSAVGGVRRPGQVTMADAVAAMESAFGMRTCSVSVVVTSIGPISVVSLSL